MSLGGVPTVSSVVIEPATLRPGQTDVRTSIRVTSNVVIHELRALVDRSQFGNIMNIPLFLQQGSNPGEGTWSCTISIPPNIPDGEYSINYLYLNPTNGGLDPLEFTSLTESQTRTVRLQRSTTPDTEPPDIVSYDIQPRVMQVSSNAYTYNYLSVSAIVRDNVGTVFVKATARASGAPNVPPTTFSVQGRIPQMSLDLGDNNTAQSGRWTGTIIPTDIHGGQLRINFYAFDAAGNMTDTRNLSDRNLTVAVEPTVSGSAAVSATRGTNGRAATTFTFPGPAAIQNITSESGECQVRISVPGRVVIDCECPQKSANRLEDEDTGRELGGGWSRIPLPRVSGSKNTTILILSIAAVIIAGVAIATYFTYSFQDSKCNSWLTRLQNLILGINTELNEPSKNQTQTDRINTMAAQFSTEISRFHEQCGTR
jgi:hypothetical protein